MNFITFTLFITWNPRHDICIYFPDSRCVYWSIHGHATPLSDPETEARSGIMVKCPLRWVRYAHVAESAA